MVGGATHADAKMLGYIDRGEYYTALLEIKTDIGVFAYLKNGEVKSRMQGTHRHGLGCQVPRRRHRSGCCMG
jgi:hypothetical protein